MSSSSVIQTQPKNVSERTALLGKSSTSASLTSSIRSTCSLSELSMISTISSFQISRHNKRMCCNFTRDYYVHDSSGMGRRDLLLTATQEDGCFASVDDYEDMFVYDLQDQLMFSIEFEEKSGYLSSQMKFSVVSSTKIGIGTVSRIWTFMESPRYEILNWDGSHLFSIGPPATSGIRSYDYKRKYEVISKDGKTVATCVHEGRSVRIKFDAAHEPFQLRDKTLILSLGFILDLLRNEEP